MSNLEPDPAEIAGASRVSVGGGGVEVLSPREVPLGGPRAMPVRRTLPQRQRSLIGAWCFADHYGPRRILDSPGMDVPPHPHTGLQTISWLFSGEIEHRDSAGVHAIVRPGELNLMTAGAGICHSEVSTSADSVLHGAQLWVALPEAARDTGRGFDHFVPTPFSRPRAVLRVFLGELDGVRSPIATHTPLLGAQLDLGSGAVVSFDVDPGFEHGVLVDRGDIAVDQTPLQVGDLAYRAAGAGSLTVRNLGERPARVLLLGGTPFTEELVMWWNFVGRSHDDIVAYRQLWESGDDRFGAVLGYRGATQRLPAPPLPTSRLRPRPNPNREDSP